MLQSPRFIYRIEQQHSIASPGRRQYELASRLSYALWGAPPDKELMRAAGAGELADRAKVQAQVRRMLHVPRTVKQSLRFVSQWLDLDRRDNMKASKARFPKWDPQLAADMRSETLAFFEEIAWKQNRPISDLFNAQVTFLTPRLAEHYGLSRSNGIESASQTASSRSNFGRHNDVKRELSGIFHAVTGAGGRFKTGQILDVKSEGLDVYNTLLAGMNVNDRMGPAHREFRAVDSIRA